MLREAGITFLFAQTHVSGDEACRRRAQQVGRRTIFNLLGPLASPARVTRQLVVSSPLTGWWPTPRRCSNWAASAPGSCMAAMDWTNSPSAGRPQPGVSGAWRHHHRRGDAGGSRPQALAFGRYRRRQCRPQCPGAARPAGGRCDRRLPQGRTAECRRGADVAGKAQGPARAPRWRTRPSRSGRATCRLRQTSDDANRTASNGEAIDHTT